MKHSHRFPLNADTDTYIIMQDYGQYGLAWEETGLDQASREGCVRRLREYLTYRRLPVITRIVCFNTEDNFARDVTEDMLKEAGWFGEGDEPHLTKFDLDEARGERIADMRREMA